MHSIFPTFLIFQVDLSAFEAQNTVTHYDNELKRLRQMTSARVIAREISAYQPVQTVRIVAYKNGEGRAQPGVVICGSTIRGVSKHNYKICRFLL